MVSFQEIAFQAELNRHEDPESEEQARLLCCEEPRSVDSNLQELRNMITDRGECTPPRMDDKFLLRFLRARGSIPARAHRLHRKMVSFQEIAFQAELNRHEDPESEEQARLLCCEEPRSVDSNLQELRNMITDRGECTPPRMDDKFLLRFLRARGSIPARAHRLLVRYCRFREQNEYLWREVDWLRLADLGNIFEGVLFDRPDVGRLIICRLGLWDPDEFPVEDLLRGALLLLEVGIMQPKLQVLGGTALVDCDGLTMRHIKHLSPSYALQAMHIMGFAFPLHQRGVHIVNCSRVFETLFHFFKRLAPADDLWRRVHFHGYNLNSLHRYIDPECLPKRYGGCRQEVSLRQWLTRINHYKNKSFDEDLRTLGYAVD